MRDVEMALDKNGEMPLACSLEHPVCCYLRTLRKRHASLAPLPQILFCALKESLNDCVAWFNSRLSIGQSYRTLHQNCNFVCDVSWREEHPIIEIGSYWRTGQILQRCPHSITNRF